MIDARVAERVWRARKNHTWMDAQVRPVEDADQTAARPSPSPFELLIFYDGDIIFRRSWSTRDEAVAHALEQLKQLQRAGWNTHW